MHEVTGLAREEGFALQTPLPGRAWTVLWEAEDLEDECLGRLAQALVARGVTAYAYAGSWDEAVCAQDAGADACRTPAPRRLGSAPPRAAQRTVFVQLVVLGGPGDGCGLDAVASADDQAGVMSAARVCTLVYGAGADLVRLRPVLETRFVVETVTDSWGVAALRIEHTDAGAGLVSVEETQQDLRLALERAGDTGPVLVLNLRRGTWDNAVVR